MTFFSRMERFIPRHPLMVRMFANFVPAAAIAGLMTIVASRNEQPKPLPVLAFTERWSDTPRIVPLSKQVRTVVILPPVAEPPVAPVAVPLAREYQPRRVLTIVKPKGDICRGKGRIYTRGGKSWKCRR